MNRCIYCSAPINPAAGQGDHIIPAAWGEFEGDVRFRRICRRCNQAIGKSEEQLIRCGPESILARFITPVSNRLRKRRTGSGRTGAHGVPPPRYEVNVGEYSMKVVPSQETPDDVYPVDQLVISDHDARRRVIELFPAMRPEQLKRKLRQSQIKSLGTGWLNCDAANWQKYVSLLRAISPNIKIEELPSWEVGAHQYPTGIRSEVTDHYFRALAKIAFHYYLVHCRRGFDGNEPCFGRIRDFIMNGGEISTIFHTPRTRFVLPFGKLPFGRTAVSRRWRHFLAADEQCEAIIIYLHLFVGPRSASRPHYVTLGQVGNAIIDPHGVWGHVYSYDGSNATGKRCTGRVRKVAIVPVRRRRITSRGGWGA